jgi:hypothetical protein
MSFGSKIEHLRCISSIKSFTSALTYEYPEYHLVDIPEELLFLLFPDHYENPGQNLVDIFSLFHLLK